MHGPSAARPLLPWILLALLGAAALAWLGLLGFVWNDYEVEAAPAFDALDPRLLRAVPRSCARPTAAR